MTWFDKQQEEKQQYVMIAKIIEAKRGRSNNVATDYSMRYEGKIPFEEVNIVLKKMIEKIDDDSFVSLREIKNVRNPYDYNHFLFGKVQHDNVFYFYILKDEIPKIGTDEPIHVVCEADKIPKSKEKFLDIVKLFI